MPKIDVKIADPKYKYVIFIPYILSKSISLYVFVITQHSAGAIVYKPHVPAL